ncbi:glycosyltransferase (plasmid) [Deinococcus taeanensis]|uniref:glycosyltransferase n=1 Tax=Deinococcus taeanensis TaxID=2737050 RepID=UPI001CDBBD75|nr:glycosyltransferase [Deinococcus taeanensis]UBV44325.1 glycosyltransferase [Deinococcus taeanensis]
MTRTLWTARSGAGRRAARTTGAPPALWVATAARGGIHGYTRALEATPLFTDWQVERLVTHDDGPLPRRLSLFARGAGTLLWRCLSARPSLVHLHSAAYGSFARKALLLWAARGVFRVPTVLHLHAGEFETFYGACPPLARALVRATLRRADRVITLSPALAAAVTRIAPGARVTVAANGVALAPAARVLARRAPRVLFAGVLIDRKDPVGLLRAWAACPRPPGARLVFAGDGPLRADLEALAAELGVSRSVDFRGWLDPAGVAAEMDQADILALPSHFEGQPLSLLEGMARGLALLSTRVGGIPDLIEDGVSGRLVPPGDPGALSAALAELLSDQDARARYGAAAYARAAHAFDIRRTWQSLDTVYRTLAQGAPRGPHD